MNDLGYYRDTPVADFPFPDTRTSYQEIAWIDFANTNPFGDGNSAGTDVEIQAESESLKERLKQQWPAILAKARQAQEDYPDAVDALIGFFEDMCVDEETRRSIIEEPYG